MSARIELLISLAVVVCLAPAGRGQPCTPAWDHDIGNPGISGGLIPAVYAIAVYDDGNGPALYVGGSFSSAGGSVVNNIARWDGSSWSALGSGTNATVYALAVYDDGNGAKLYAGGFFTQAGGQTVNYIASWNGSAWSGVGGGMSTSALVRDFVIFNDGGGDALFIGGSFFKAGTVFADNIAKWNGSTFSPVGTGVNSTVEALAVFDDGGGDALFVGGDFTAAGGNSANHVAKWNGSTWSALAEGGFNGVNGLVTTLIATDSTTAIGGAPALYVGGNFDTAGGISGRNYVAKWDGTNWSGLGTGTNQRLYDFALFDDASGAGYALYAGGRFTLAGGVSASRVAKWNGSSWAALGAGVDDDAYVLEASGDVYGLGPRLAVGGNFTQAGGTGTDRIAEWVGCSAFVDCNSNGVDDPLDIAGGTSTDCDVNEVPDECDLAAGADDCQPNGVLDECELAAGTAQDCNTTGIPDVCELAGNDCNANQIPDTCELAGNDCNNNQVPDDCELAGNDCNNNGTPDECDTDCDSNGTPDDCESFVDCNSNSVPDICELAGNDCNADQVPDDCQLADNDCNTDGMPDDCQLAGNDCNNNQVPDDCEPDCNTNGVADECDIAGATSEDFDEDGIPDECEADCQPNGVPDYLDILFGVSLDCNSNEVPDECDRDIADLDGDGDSDASDHGVFLGCLTGAACESSPCTPAAYADPCCLVADYDEDGDVDLIDWMGFQSRYLAAP